MPVSAIAFDLDGTLIDSNQVKRRGFDHVFEGYPDGLAHVAAVLETHRKSFRTVVIREVLRRISAEGGPDFQPTEEHIAELASRYNRFCIDGAVACPEIAGAGEMLQKLASTHALFINTATATEAAVEIIDRRGWTRHFKAVLGFPPSKEENLETIARMEGLLAGDMLMVGDDDHDLEAAAAFGCPAVALLGPTSHFTRPLPLAISSLAALPPLLDQI